MKKIALFIVTLWLLTPAASWAQQGNFTIIGKLKNVSINNRYVYLIRSEDGKFLVDSGKVSGDGYELKGTVTNVGPATLYDINPMLLSGKNTSGHQAPIFLRAETFSVVHTDSFPAVSFSSSVANTDYSRLKKQIDPLMARGWVLSGQYRTALSDNDTTASSRLRQELEALEQEINISIMRGFAKEHPASPIALYALENSVDPHSMDADTIAPIFARLSEANKTSAEGVAFQKQIEKARLTSIGQVAPDFTQGDTLGRPVSLSTFRGSYVLIDFWASWCGPCRMENPNVVATYNRFKSKGFRIIGVSLDKADAKDKWIEAIHKDGLFWTQLSDLQFWNNAVAKAYDINSIPQNFLLAPDGRIIAKGLRGEALVKKLQELYTAHTKTPGPL